MVHKAVSAAGRPLVSSNCQASGRTTQDSRVASNGGGAPTRKAGSRPWRAQPPAAQAWDSRTPPRSHCAVRPRSDPDISSPQHAGRSRALTRTCTAHHRSGGQASAGRGGRPVLSKLMLCRQLVRAAQDRNRLQGIANTCWRSGSGTSGANMESSNGCTKDVAHSVCWYGIWEQKLQRHCGTTASHQQPVQEQGLHGCRGGRQGRVLW